MAKPCGCGSKQGKKTEQFSKITYVLKDAAGETVRSFGNRNTAARLLKKYPGYTLEPVEA